MQVVSNDDGSARCLAHAVARIVRDLENVIGLAKDLSCLYDNELRDARGAAAESKGYKMRNCARGNERVITKGAKTASMLGPPHTPRSGQERKLQPGSDSATSKCGTAVTSSSLGPRAFTPKLLGQPVHVVDEPQLPCGSTTFQLDTASDAEARDSASNSIITFSPVSEEAKSLRILQERPAQAFASQHASERTPASPSQHALERTPASPTQQGKSSTSLLTNASTSNASTPHMRDIWSHTDEQLVDHYVESLKHLKPRLSKVYGRFESKTGSSKLTLVSFGHERLMIHPFSTQRLVWDFASIPFLTNDVFMVPLQVFDIPYSVVLDVWKAVCAIFWTADWAMSFRTGFLAGQMIEMRSIPVAKSYIKRTCFSDFSMLVVQWLHVIGGSCSICDTLQALRLLRLFKLSRLRRAIMERSNSNHVHLYLDTLHIATWFVISVHFISCGWYWLGEFSRGWTRESHIDNADLLYSYFAACRWTVAQVSGRTDLELRTAPEYVYTCCACVFGILILSVFISSITNLMIEFGALNRERHNQFCALKTYLKRNNVASDFAVVIKAGLKAQQKAAINLEREREVLQVLPKNLMVDLFCEIREPSLVHHQLFADFAQEFPRVMRRICADAVKPMTMQEDEKAFALGDACSRTLFLERGLLEYQWKRRAGVRHSFHRMSPFLEKQLEKHTPKDGSEEIKPKQWVSEASLWVEWENQGELTGCEPSSLLAVEAHEFSSVVELFREARARSTIYARAFARKLAEEGQELWSDVTYPLRDYFAAEDCEIVEQSERLAMDIVEERIGRAIYRASVAASRSVLTSSSTSSKSCADTPPCADTP